MEGSAGSESELAIQIQPKEVGPVLRSEEVGRVLRSEREKKREKGRNKKDPGFEEFVVMGSEEGIERRREGRDAKGYGVFATRDFYQGDYICQYKGDFISTLAAQLYNGSNSERECYQLWVNKRVNGRKKIEFVIDASPRFYQFTMGRNINHEPHTPNLIPKYMRSHRFDFECVYFLCGRDVKEGEEFCWNYADHRTGTTLGKWSENSMRNAVSEYEREYKVKNTADLAEIYYEDGKIEREGVLESPIF